MSIKQRHPVAAYDSMLAHIISVRQVVLSEWFDKDMTLHGLNDHK